MNKKRSLIIISLIIVILLLGIIINNIKNNSNEINTGNMLDENKTKNIVEISEEITDECTEEWKEYNEELQKAFEEASVNIGDNDVRYCIKSVNGYIYVYYLNDYNEEILYKKTTISTEYLSQEDIENLEIGIEIEGTENLNKMLEDFE